MPRKQSVRTVAGYGANLRERLKTAGLTQVELANASGLSRQTISRALNTDEVSTRSAKRIDDVLAKRAAPTTPIAGRPVASPASRGSHALASATDLVEWSKRRHAQEDLPLIVRRLIMLTADGLQRLSVRSGEGVQLPGWDGRVIAAKATAFVPEGQSAWEMGTSDPGSKAQSDYEARLTNPGDVDPASTTFVFVTSRRWPQKDSWVAARRAEGRWKDVRAIDADDLEAWLESAPSVHLWVSERVAVFPQGAQDLSSWWIAWSNATRPVLSGEFILAGRTEQIDRIQNWREPAEPLGILSESRGESVATIAAAFTQLPADDSAEALARAVVVMNAAAWRHLVAARTPLILIPLFEGADTTSATRAGHVVRIPLGEGDVEVDNCIRLEAVSRESAARALIAVGVANEDRARELAGLARRSMMALRRQIATATALQRPEWARPDVARTVLPALFVGGWNEKFPGDKTFMEQLGLKPYDEIATAADRWAHGADPLMRRRASIWYLVSREDAWQLLARYVKHDDIERFVTLAIEVLATPDPRLELPLEQQWMASIYDKRPSHSPLLRQGLAATAAILGSHGDILARSGATDPSLPYVGKRIVRDALARANADPRIWSSLSGILPDLAEAAPDEFLDAVETGLHKAERPVATLFIDEKSDPLFSSSPHTGLLWALERLAWSPNYLGRVVTVLVELAKQDPGGRLRNRPSATLNAIFRPWFPQTAAGVEVRFAAIDSVASREPDSAWDILIATIPELHGVGFHSSKPRWNDWAGDKKRSVTQREYAAAITGAVERLLRLAGNKGSRWADLIGRLERLGPREHEGILRSLDTLKPDHLSEEDRKHIWGAIRSLVARHREFPDAKWAMGPERVAEIDALRDRFVPQDLVARFAWLFKWHPELPDLKAPRIDHAAFDAEVRGARIAAIREIHSSSGLPGLLAIANACEQPQFLGSATAEAGVCDAQENSILNDLLASDNRAYDVFARSFAGTRQQFLGRPWVNTKLDELKPKLTPVQQGALVSTLPADQETWTLAASLGEDVEREYWNFVGWVSKDSDLEFAIRKLLHFGKIGVALHFIGIFAHDAKVPSDLILEALERLMSGEVKANELSQSFGWDLRRMLEQLVADATVDKSRVARIEWNFLPLLDRGDSDGAIILEQSLAESPSFFSELVSFVFRAEGEPKKTEQEITAESRERANRAYSLLSSWRTVPGFKDGTVDEGVLRSWVTEAREALSNAGRGAIGDQMIGQMLSGSPSDADGTWPCKAVRAIIEEVKSEDIGAGFTLGVYNGRGVVTRSIREGGAQEHALADQYDGYAAAVAQSAPRTAALLRSLVDTYRAEARREDDQVALEEDLDL